MPQVNTQRVKDPKESLPISEHIAKRFDTVMRCPVCDGLHDEYSLACEAEAAATLQQRYDDIILRPRQEGTDQDTREKRQETILSSKKRQLKTVSHLEQHRTLAHSA